MLTNRLIVSICNDFIPGRPFSSPEFETWVTTTQELIGYPSPHWSSYGLSADTTSKTSQLNCCWRTTSPGRDTSSSQTTQSGLLGGRSARSISSTRHEEFCSVSGYIRGYISSLHPTLTLRFVLRLCDIHSQGIVIPWFRITFRDSLCNSCPVMIGHGTPDGTSHRQTADDPTSKPLAPTTILSIVRRILQPSLEMIYLGDQPFSTGESLIIPSFERLFLTIFLDLLLSLRSDLCERGINRSLQLFRRHLLKLADICRILHLLAYNSPVLVLRTHFRPSPLVDIVGLFVSRTRTVLLGAFVFLYLLLMLLSHTDNSLALLKATTLFFSTSETLLQWIHSVGKKRIRHQSPFSIL